MEVRGRRGKRRGLGRGRWKKGREDRRRKRVVWRYKEGRKILGMNDRVKV